MKGNEQIYHWTGSLIWYGIDNHKLILNSRFKIFVESSDENNVDILRFFIADCESSPLGATTSAKWIHHPNLAGTSIGDTSEAQQSIKVKLNDLSPLFCRFYRCSQRYYTTDSVAILFPSSCSFANFIIIESYSLIIFLQISTLLFSPH